MDKHHLNDLCRVCNSSTDFYFKVRQWPLNQCPNCKIVQVVKKPTDSELADIYSQTYFNSSKYQNLAPLEKEMARRLKLLKECRLPTKGKILEIGAAEGSFISRLPETYDIYVNDFSEEMVETLKTQFPIPESHFQPGPIEDLSYPENFFDAIVIWDVIEHVWDVTKMATKVSKWLKPGGVLLVSSPDASSLSFRILGKRWPFMTPPEHLTFFCQKSLGKLFNPKGLDLNKYFKRGKWVDIKFLIYKLGRVFPFFGKLKIQDRLPRFLENKMLYVPTNDIFYAILKKRA